MDLTAIMGASYGAFFKTKTGVSAPVESKQNAQVQGSGVSLSGESLVMGRLDQEMRSRGQVEPSGGDVKGLAGQMNTLDPTVPLAAAERQLKALMKEQGIASDPPFSLDVVQDGSISVSPADHPNKDALEDMANSSRELRNNLVRASNLAHLQAIGRAAYKAHLAAEDASPEQWNSIYNQLFQYIDQISGYDYSASFEDGKLTSSFKDASGKPVSIPEFHIERTERSALSRYPGNAVTP